MHAVCSLAKLAASEPTAGGEEVRFELREKDLEVSRLKEEVSRRDHRIIEMSSQKSYYEVNRFPLSC